MTGVGSYASGVTAAVTATPKSGYTFTGWSGACYGSGSCSVSCVRLRLPGVPAVGIPVARVGCRPGCAGCVRSDAGTLWRRKLIALEQGDGLKEKQKHRHMDWLILII